MSSGSGSGTFSFPSESDILYDFLLVFRYIFVLVLEKDYEREDLSWRVIGEIPNFELYLCPD